ncbi:MAG: phosphatase, partial [Bacteroidia bacterium]
GENGITKGIINPAAFQRGVDAVKYFKGIISSQHIEEIFAFATAALRRASNADKFIEAVKNETGIKIEIISGEKEAEYIYYGVHQAVELGVETSLVMDIGGGSVEFILCNENEIFWKGSFDIGAAILLEMFKPSDPANEGEINKMRDYFTETLKPLIHACNKYSPVQLVGSSGSFDTLADVTAYRFHTPEILAGKTEYSFDIHEIRQVISGLISSTHAEREQIKGIAAMRIDMIVVGSLLIKFVIEKLGINKIKLSSYALKEGVLWQVMKKGKISAQE